MKVQILFVASMMVAATLSCNKDNSYETSMQTIVLSAGISDDPDSRLYLGDDTGSITDIYWHQDDAISVTVSGESYVFHAKEVEENAKFALFSYTGRSLPILGKDHHYVFTYPHSGVPSLENQSGKLDEIWNHYHMEANYTPRENENWSDVSLAFRTKVAVVKITLSNEDFKGKTVGDITLKAKEVGYTANGRYVGNPETGSITIWLCVEPAVLSDCSVEAVCGGAVYAASFASSDKTLVAGKLYKVNKNVEKVCTDLSPFVEGQEGKYKTANSYIVTGVGYYRFKAVKGCGNELAGSASDVHPVGTPVSATVLWESDGTSNNQVVGSIINPEVEYNNGYVYFTTAETFKAGNAVIAVKDANGVILWSWHIWLPKDAPQGDIYKNNAGTFMDRNLGALSANPADGVATYGLLYQWGRKDPFPGAGNTNYDKVQANTTLGTAFPLMQDTSAEIGTITYSIQHPTVYYTAKQSSQNSDYNWLFGTDNTKLWGRLSDKEIYDPCPYGSRVPFSGKGTNGVWKIALGGETSYKGAPFYSYYIDASDAFGAAGESVYFPIAPCRSYTDGSLMSVVGTLYISGYWSSEVASGKSYYMSVSDSNINAVASMYRTYGRSVRCIYE